MEIFSRWRTKKASTEPANEVIRPDAAPLVVGLNAVKWRESAIKGLEGANKRMEEINAEIDRVEQEHREQVAQLTALKDQEINRLKAHREGTRQVIEAARAALGTFPAEAPPMPAPVPVTDDQLQNEAADALESALQEVDTTRHGLTIREMIDNGDLIAPVTPVFINDIQPPVIPTTSKLVIEPKRRKGNERRG